MRLSSKTSRFARAALSAIGFAGLLGTALLLHDHTAAAATQYTINAGGGGRGISVESFRPNVIFVNEGDTIKFVNPYEEIHTVTYTTDGKVPDLITPAGPPPKDGPPKLIFNPKVGFPSPAKDAKIDGSAYANSGILNKGDSWLVSFPKQGTFKIICVVHPGMEANVSVLAAGTHVPDQAQRDFEAASQLQAGISAGERSASAVKPTSSAGANGTTSWEVLNAPSAGQSDVMQFIPPRLSIGVGDTVTWKNNTPVPHTITFTSGAPAPDLVIPEPQAGGPPNLVLNPQALFPSRTPPTYSGSGYYNSGFITTDKELATGGTSYALTFTAPGTYSYICALHADQGMAGVVVVGSGGAAGSAPSIRAPSTGDAGLKTAGNGLGFAWWLPAAFALPLLAFGGLLVARERTR